MASTASSSKNRLKRVVTNHYLWIVAVMLAIAVLIMLPRIFLFSPHPTDAILEAAAVAAIGYLVMWMYRCSQDRRTRAVALEATGHDPAKKHGPGGALLARVLSISGETGCVGLL